MLDEILTVLFIQVHDDLGIGVRIEAMTLLFKGRAQFDVIEYLAVETDPDSPVFVVDRLLAAGKVDDAETCRGKADLRIGEIAVAVRPAMI